MLAYQEERNKKNCETNWSQHFWEGGGVKTHIKDCFSAVKINAELTFKQIKQLYLCWANKSSSEELLSCRVRVRESSYIIILFASEFDMLI
jgi:hypothetical protein